MPTSPIRPSIVLALVVLAIGLASGRTRSLAAQNLSGSGVRLSRPPYAIFVGQIQPARDSVSLLVK
ncbi:MAG: hypothetical protein WCP29_18905 [Acidobacteriota bacterium]